MITDAMKAAIPKALYGCADQGCAELVSHYPEDLFWWQDGFYCDACIDDCGETQEAGPNLKAVLEGAT